MKRMLSALVAVAVLLAALPATLAADTDTAPALWAIFHNGAPTDILEIDGGAYLITDTYNKVIWQLEHGREPTVLVGRTGVAVGGGVPVGGYNDAAYADAAFASPWGLTPFLDGYLVSDPENNAIRYMGDGQVYTAAGTGNPGRLNGRGVRAGFTYPTGMATDEQGNVYIADTGNHTIRRMTPQGDVSTFAGTTGRAGYADGEARMAAFDSPTGLCWHDGALYVADTGNHVIRKIEDTEVSTFAGAAHEPDTDAAQTGDWVDGEAAQARFSAPMGLAFDSAGDLFVSDSGNATIRKVSLGVVSTFISADTAAGDPYPVEPRGLLALDSGLLVCDSFAGVVFTDARPFDDVAPGDWFYDDVQYMVRHGLFQGVDSGSFEPQQAMTRGMLATVLGRMAGVETGDYATVPFGDVRPESYCAPYVAWAQAQGLVTGRALPQGADGGQAARFAPDSPVSRAELMVMVWRYATYAGMDVSATGDLSGFEDLGELPGYALEAARWAVGSGMVSGLSATRLEPQADVTRAQAAAMLHHFHRAPA